MTDRSEAVPAKGVPQYDRRSPAEIERDIEATRDRLAATIDQISDRVKPANVVARTKASLLTRAQDTKDSLLAQMREPDGSLRPDRVGALAAAAALALVGIVVRRRRRRR